MSLLGLLLLSTLVLPQDAVPSGDYTIPQSELTSRLMKNFVLNPQQARRLDPIQVEKLESHDHTCFAIRTYIFKREDGNAPELAGTTTCTPSKVFRQKRAGNRRGKLVLLDF